MSELVRTGPGLVVARSGDHGWGLFATRAFAEGTLILRESPLCTSDQSQPADPALYTSAWRLADAVASSQLLRAQLLDTSASGLQPMHWAGLKWEEAKDRPALRRLVARRGLSQNEAFRLYAVVASVNLRCGLAEDVLGVYALCSFLNHSCAPSARMGFVGRDVVLKAVVDIAAGQEVTFSYLSGEFEGVLRLLGRDELRKFMLHEYGFECGCLECKPSACPPARLPAATPGAVDDLHDSQLGVD